MILIVQSLLSVFATILLGYGVRRSLLPDRTVWTGLERLAFFVLLPALLVHSLATAEIAPGAAWRLILAILAAILVSGGAAFALRKPMNMTGPVFASVFQGATRFNSYVILGVSGTLMGSEGVALASLALAFMIVTANVLAVMVLVRYGQRGGEGAPGVAKPGEAKPGAATLARSLAGNPLILACVAGVLWNISGAPMPTLIGAPLSFVGSAAVGVALLSVGAALELRQLFSQVRLVAAACALKLLLQPAVLLAAAAVLELEAGATTIGVVCASVPIATSAYIMSAQLGADAVLMARLITLSTLAAMATMLPWLYLASGSAG